MNSKPMNKKGMDKKEIFITASLLTIFAIVGAVMVGATFMETKDDILHNEKLTLLRKLNHIVPSEKYDNDLLHDSIMIQPAPQLGTSRETSVYRARKGDLDVAVVLTSVAPSGYNGPIELLVGIYADGKLAGVRVVKHRETPGLGDVVDIAHSDWLLGFDGRSLSDPAEKNWKVKRDGGIFDQFTGATITPRAVVKAVHNALLYFQQNREALFSAGDEADNKAGDTSDGKSTETHESH